MEDYVYYRGRTNNIKRRLLQHKNGHSKYTKRFHGAIQLVYLEEINGLNDKHEGRKARMRENALKRWSRNKVENVIKIKQRKIQELINKYLNVDNTIERYYDPYKKEK